MSYVQKCREMAYAANPAHGILGLVGDTHVALCKTWNGQNVIALEHCSDRKLCILKRISG
jgi:hypothetical protein